MKTGAGGGASSSNHCPFSPFRLDIPPVPGDGFPSMINRAKDKMIATVVRRLLEGKLGRYGEVNSLSVESKECRMNLEFLPTGEDAPIQITIAEYRVLTSDDGVVIRFQSVTADRPWVANLLEDFVQGLEIPLRGSAAKLADWIL